MTADKTTQDLLEAPLWSLFFRLAFPAVGAMLAVGLYQFVDAVFVGQFVGPEGMGAVSLVYPVALINMAVSGLIGVGSASFLSRAIGRGDRRGIDKIYSNLVVLNLIINGCLVAAGWITAPALLAFFGGEGIILDYAVVYARVLFAGMFFANFGVSANMLIRAEGRLAAAMVILCSGAAVNLVLDPIFIILLGLDVFGAGLATVIGQGCTALVGWFYMKRNEAVMSVSFFKNRVEPGILKEILTVGFSALALPLFTIIEIAVEFIMIRRYAGMDELLTFGVVMRLLILYIPPIWGIGLGLQPLVGVNTGAGNFDRIRRALGVFTIGGTVMAVLLWLPVVLAPGAILSWFITDPAVVEAGRQAPRIFLILLPLYGIIFNTLVYFQATGRALAAAVLVTGRMLIFYVPFQFLFPRIFGTVGLWFCNPMSDIITLTLVGILALKYHYRSRAGLHKKEISLV